MEKVNFAPDNDVWRPELVDCGSVSFAYNV